MLKNLQFEAASGQYTDWTVEDAWDPQISGGILTYVKPDGTSRFHVLSTEPAVRRITLTDPSGSPSGAQQGTYFLNHLSPASYKRDITEQALQDVFMHIYTDSAKPETIQFNGSHVVQYDEGTIRVKTAAGTDIHVLNLLGSGIRYVDISMNSV